MFAQIRGFGEYGFPESHAASFALIAYATAWLRCHHPAAFLCALLNAQPMGFYAPATLIAESQRRGVDVLPVDINSSRWDCCLQRDGMANAAAPWSVRMGLSCVAGLGQRERRLLQVEPPPYASVDELSERVGLGRGPLRGLAGAGARDGLAGHRRAALWQAQAPVPAGAQSLALPWRRRSPPSSLEPLSAASEVIWDYRHTGHSVHDHPLAARRAQLRRMGCSSAAELGKAAAASTVRTVGWVICRQRPETAHGVMFLTLEDETGLINVVLWREICSRYSALLRLTQVLGVAGRIQRAKGQVHLVARSLWDGHR